MIEDTYHVEESNSSVVMKFLSRRLRVQMEFWPVIAVAIIAFVLFWAGVLVYAYVADDLNSRPADERSMPGPRSY
jgi:hypothetical protein